MTARLNRNMKPHAADHAPGWRRMAVISAIVAIQLSAAAYFCLKILAEVFLVEIPFIPWEVQEHLEILASVGLLLGLASTLALLGQTWRRMGRLNEQVQAVSGQFQDLMERQFDEWGLTATEAHVALMVIKGFSNAEIAGFRGTTESTIKSQITAIFRKSGLTSRHQLVTSLVEDLVSAVPVETAAPDREQQNGPPPGGTNQG